MARDSCLARVTAGVAVGGAVGGAVGAVYGTYEAIRKQEKGHYFVMIASKLGYQGREFGIPFLSLQILDFLPTQLARDVEFTRGGHVDL
ncbi:hypothetical protein OIU85_028948 [Salix viminalis]|uniref:Uncharacterized protein n=1 Tax=Salix viminalis TaxID=40686 RepID=A0A9Q0T729_SALVM|nr:hypothetical protein OIU85_028948 [Salix viminalis]